MAEEQTCEECGAALPVNAPAGLCPRCLARIGLNLVPTISVPESDIQIERTGAVIGRYKLLEQVGEGGFGVVYMAQQQEPVQRKVALKVIKAGMDTKEVIARFEAERQALALMDHPNIARVLDGGTTAAGRPYFVMELVRGIPITDYCDQANLPTCERLRLFIMVCHAVQHAHQKGIIHRDLKPSNVLVTLHDGEPVPKVIDFGVAKALGQKLTEKTLFTGFNHMIGTPAYMSPEQAALGGLDIDTRADIYSLGVLLYELLTGATPFDAETFHLAELDEIRRMIREAEPPKPSNRLQTLGARLRDVAKHRRTEPAALSRLIHGDLDWVVMRCLEKDRKRRYETVNGLAADVARHLNSEPIVARPPSRLYRLQKSIQRNRLVFGAASAVFAALLIGLAVSTAMFLKERRTRARAEAAELAESRLRQQAEAGEKFARAELLGLQGQMEEAQRIVESIPLTTIDNFPNRAIRLLNNLGEWNVRHQQWQRAISNFTLLVELNPAEHLNYHALGPLLAHVGDAERYRQTCRKALAQFSKTENPNVAERMAKDCLLLPDAGVDLTAVSEMAQTAVVFGKSSPDIRYFECTKGLAEYRLGHFASAVDWMKKAERSGDRLLWIDAKMVTAMAHYHLHQVDLAQNELATGLKLTETEARSIDSDSLFANKDMHWADWMIAHILAREAKALIQGEIQPVIEKKSDPH
jgi:serine/threonine protein kinase